ncbi:multidrug effflux MFS transporter [Methylophaga sp. OBS4]|uniref:multidrug effflux MFS transporter n=1 Tax=Methylophaga sp. OBS4 TaxID=2991935 RepID=UPI00224D1C5E|nr:multidrug effflux MFS transporter [Methylophaga sp. OBS4]MCX4187557.1 multidrug effflux MFS transporter [Methylophaga sp. OBS4]
MNKAFHPTPAMIYMLAALTALAPLAIDAYLPAIPDMAEYFAASIHQTELSLSLFLAGFALGQIIGGPFSDHFGRRAATGSGISLFCLGTLGIIFSDSMSSVWLFRVIQAIGGGLAVVNSAAVIRDLSKGQDSARHLSNMAVIMMLAPLLAPLIGMLLLHISGWRLIFYFLLAYGLLIGLALFFKLPETRQKTEDRPSAFRRYWMVLRHRVALGFICSQCFALGGMFAFITGSPSVYMGFFGINETIYPFLFGANVIGMIIANRINIRLLRHYHPQNLLGIGQSIQLVAGGLLLAYVSFSTAPSIVVVVPIIIVFIGAMGLIVANATSCTVEYFPSNSATATALLGAGGFATGALSGSLVGMWGDGTPQPMALIMFGCALAAPLMRRLVHASGTGHPSAI